MKSSVQLSNLYDKLMMSRRLKCFIDKLVSILNIILSAHCGYFLISFLFLKHRIVQVPYPSYQPNFAAPCDF